MSLLTALTKQFASQMHFEYAGGPATPLQVAVAMNLTPTSGTFRNLCGAAIAYGLTTGGYNSTQITLEDLGRRIVQPLEEGDDEVAKREAILKPRIVGDFLRKYQNSPLPRRDIALNVLITMGVPKERSESVYTLILDSAQTGGFIREIKGKQFIDLTGVAAAVVAKASNNEPEGHEIEIDELSTKKDTPTPSSAASSSAVNRRVFITHGKNREFIEPIKKLLGFGELIPVVSVDKQSVSKPVPDKVMDDMRSCGAAIIHVDEELKFIDQEAKEHVLVNQNVLIEIGAAMALYGRRFILLVKDGVRLPSNLQGLYEVRYKSDALDGDTTIRLLEAINDIKNNPAPSRYSEANS
ncbi:hypothetical protein A6X21_18245 [Planctopirus hydrillae]|uniref:CD-NTase-associated protein 12/Pycsar effector protein TIR domain-containing protein n=2 Tax=Planctopirus hydrillae TaxID=1841610 RepID=A0A1C3EKB9_9PLAN|nr:hypothetical protein A6X21_18245 [Planctopirus hydrillae]